MLSDAAQKLFPANGGYSARVDIGPPADSPALKDDWVQTLAESKDGTLWIGTVTGLTRYRKGEFVPYFSRRDIDALPILINCGYPIFNTNDLRCM